MALISSKYFKVYEDPECKGKYILTIGKSKVKSFDFFEPINTRFGYGFAIKSARTEVIRTFEYFKQDPGLLAFFFKPICAGTCVSRVEVYFEKDEFAEAALRLACRSPAQSTVEILKSL